MSLHFEEADQRESQRHTRNLGRRARESSWIRAEARNGEEPPERATLRYIQPFRKHRSSFDRSKKAKGLNQRRRCLRRREFERRYGCSFTQAFIEQERRKNELREMLQYLDIIRNALAEGQFFDNDGYLDKSYCG